MIEPPVSIGPVNLCQAQKHGIIAAPSCCPTLAGRSTGRLTKGTALDGMRAGTIVEKWLPGNLARVPVSVPPARPLIFPL